MSRRIVVVGCGAGGGTAAQFARKTDRKAEVTIFEQGLYPQYSKCGLPFVLSGRISGFEDLVEFSEDWFKKAGIDLFLGSKVTGVDFDRRVVFAVRGDVETEREFDSLIIATGAKPIVPPIENIRKGEGLLDGVYVLRTLDDAKRISVGVEEGKKVVIIGAGLVGLELAESFYGKKMKVTVVEALPNVLPFTLDSDMSELVLETLKGKIDVFTNHIAVSVDERDEAVERVCIKDKETGEVKELEADLVVVAAGTKPDVWLAERVGCEIGEAGGVVVDERCETSIESVYAVGDCTEFKDFVTNRPVCVGLASIVVRQGIAAGVNAAGGSYTLPRGVLQTCTSAFFGLEIAAVGPVKNALEDTPVVTSRLKGSSLPGYFPGGEPITMKVGVHGDDGRILYAQGVGCNAAHRVNLFACAVLGGMNIEDFRRLETAYAPCIAPVLDIVTLVSDVVSLKLSRRRS